MFDCKCLGAIDAETKRYVRPSHASKGVKYSCIECDSPVIFKSGKIKRPHFAHKPGSLCSYYNRCNESQIHKEAKLGLRQYLSEGNVLTIIRNCIKCRDRVKVKREESETVVCEYVAPDKCRYDVCILDSSNNHRCVLEVKHTHETTSYRPEPWYELDAFEILLGIERNHIRVKCERQECCKCQLDEKCLSNGLCDMIPSREKIALCLMCKKHKAPYTIGSELSICVCHDCIWGDFNSIFDRALDCFIAYERKRRAEKIANDAKEQEDPKKKEMEIENERLKQLKYKRMFAHIDQHIEEWSKLGFGYRCVCGIMFPDNFWRTWHQKRCNVYLNQKYSNDDKVLKITRFFKLVS
jgi:hypothetical protein